MASRIHTLMQGADDGDTVAGRPETDNTLIDTAPSIAWSDVGTACACCGASARSARAAR